MWCIWWPWSDMEFGTVEALYAANGYVGMD